MNFFRKRPKQPEFPVTIDFLVRYGQSEYYSAEEKEALGLQTEDLWPQLYDTIFPLAQAELLRGESTSFATTVADLALPVGGWAVYGACVLLSELGYYSLEQLQQDPPTRALLDAAVAFLRVRRTPPEKVRSQEWSHWLASGSTPETWLPDAPPAS